MDEKKSYPHILRSRLPQTQKLPKHQKSIHYPKPGHRMLCRTWMTLLNPREFISGSKTKGSIGRLSASAEFSILPLSSIPNSGVSPQLITAMKFVLITNTY